MTALQKIIKGAKALQKKNKSLSWKEAIQKSSKAYNAEKKPAVKKKVVKKSVRKKVIGRKPAVKKSARKKVIKKKPAVRKGRHTDTKSHNVNIRVMSGFKNEGIMREYEKALNELDYNTHFLAKEKKLVTEFRKKGYAKENTDRNKKIIWINALDGVMMYSNNIKLYKKRLSELKKQL